MNTDVNLSVGEIPKDLLEQSQIALSMSDVSEIDTEMAAMLPPCNIAQLVLMERTEDQDEELADWMFEQQRLWLEVEQLSEQLTIVYDRDDIPAWRAEPWAMTIQSKWGAGLANAVVQAQVWLRS